MIVMETNNKLILIGFMGTGKSSVANGLARELGLPHLDMDAEIVKAAGKSIPEIFAEHGEQHFRTLESDVLDSLLKAPANAVIATGGGAVLKPSNCELMLRHGLVVALRASEQVIISRVQQDKGRPLLQGDVAERVRTLMQTRAKAYDFAHLSLDTSTLSIEQVVAEIVKAWHENEVHE
jgi:shikimate kinase